MATYTYIKKTEADADSLIEQIQIVNDYHVDRIFIEEYGSIAELEALIRLLAVKDTLIVYSLSVIELNREDMCEFFQLLKDRSIHLLSIRDHVDTTKIETTNFINNCLVYLTAEARMSTRKNKRKLSVPKEIGRPKISNDTINRIIFLRENEKRSIRSIATECDVSIGTVHKYLK